MVALEFRPRIFHAQMRIYRIFQFRHSRCPDKQIQRSGRRGLGAADLTPGMYWNWTYELRCVCRIQELNPVAACLPTAYTVKYRLSPRDEGFPEKWLIPHLRQGICKITSCHPRCREAIKDVRAVPEGLRKQLKDAPPGKRWEKMTLNKDNHVHGLKEKYFYIH